MYLSAKSLGPCQSRTMPREPMKTQWNIRVDLQLLERFREYCEQNGLDPAAQIVLFMKRVVAAEYDFQDKLWEALRAEAQ
jgi:hypothetical protein